MADTTTDHNAIRKWAERHGGKPAAVDRTHKGDDVGIIRIMFPKAAQSEHDHLVEISWDEFFREFDERNLALLYDPGSLFSKIVSRDTVERREQGDHDAARHAGESRSERRGEGDRGGRSAGKESDSLKGREYKDSEGNVHHHTKTYMREHGKDD